VAVVGLRTAGLYMAPLCAATLDRLGHPRVELLSLRPGAPTLGAEERRLRAIAGAGGWAFVVDDPTWRASAFEKTCETLKRHGFPAHRIWLTACEIGNQPALRPGTADATDTPPEKKVWRGFEAAQKVVLKKTEWQIHAHLANDSAERYLNRPQALARLGARHVTVIKGHPFSETGEPPAVTGLAPGSRQRRFHVQKVYEIEVESDSGRHIELVVGRGVGVGFFGYHSYLVAHHLDGLIPDVLAFENGVLFTRWERAGRIEPGTPGSPDMEVVAQYIARRANQLHLEPSSAPARETRAVYSGARQVARLLGASMGGVGSLAQFRAAHALSSHLGPARPASIDARMGPAEWVRNGRGDLVKVDFEEHGVDITDRRVNDPVHDVAAASIAFRLDAESEKRLVETYAQSTGDRDRLRARLAFHKLMAGGAELEAIHFEDQPASRWLREEFARRLVATEQALTRTVNGFLATAYLSDVNSREGGDVWALDLDDTLETDWLGFETTSPAGARALRRLAAHDQLVLTSTGRSLEEVRDRCETYRIAGGIAEYGSVAWDARHQRQLVIVSEESQLALERLREAILAETDILVDPRYRHSLRLFRFTPDGRRGMNVDEVTAVIERHAIQGLDVVEGYRKSVVYAAGTDKSHALAPLLTSLGVDRHARRLHVVGDEFTDLGLLALADCRHAPGNASAALRARSAEMSMFIAKRGRGAGVSQAVNRQLHAWGRGCALCRQADLDQADRVLVDVLGVQDRSRLGRFAYALHPASIRAFEL
jgi:hydroxymethylpyrimidine pyrophosphatase-like HAD family hydrolase